MVLEFGNEISEHVLFVFIDLNVYTFVVVSQKYMNVKFLILKLKTLRFQQVPFHICDMYEYVGQENEE